MPRRIGVAMVVNNLDVGGLEKVVVSLLNHLDRDRFERYLICLNGAGKMADEVHLPTENRLVLEKQPKWRIPLIGGVDVSLLKQIRGFARSKQIDILHAHNLAPLLYCGMATRLWPMRDRPALVYSEHNQLYSATAKQRERLRYYLMMTNKVIAVSQDLQRTLVSDIGARRDKVAVVYNGIDGKRFMLQDPQKVRRELGIADDTFVFGTAVVLSEQKGIRYLLKAAQRVLAASRNVHFLIAGDGPKRAELENQTRELGLGDHVRFLGYRRDIPELISSFDAYVLPSLWEGLPLALIEALAIGKPVICTNVGGNPEIIEDGVNGFVVAPRDSDSLADRLLQLLHDRPAVAAVQARNVAKYRQHFSLESMVGAHERMFEELAAVRGVPGG
jgi:glycosyltransferase involved in cell wall biosynthesis